jgi:ATP-dependent DNA helicase RecG
VKQLLEERLVEYTIPEKPNSRLQKYRLTEKGRALIIH